MVTRTYAGTAGSYTAKNYGAISANLSAASLRPFFAVELMFDNPFYFWSGTGSITIDGIEYTGLGTLIAVTELQETTDVRAANAQVTLSAISSSLLSAALNNTYHGRLARIKFGLDRLDYEFLQQETGDLILQETGARISVAAGSPALLATLFVGYMDMITIADGGEEATLQLDIESKLVDLERPRVVRYTTEAQALRFPNAAQPDLAFEYTNDLQERRLMWGKGVRPSGGGLF